MFRESRRFLVSPTIVAILWLYGYGDDQGAEGDS
jgi:hypothetical protein